MPREGDDPLEQRVARHVEGRYEEDVVAGEVRFLGEHEVRPHVQLVEGPMELVLDARVVRLLCPRRPALVPRARPDGHELQAPVRVDAVQDGHPVLRQETREGRTEALQLAADAHRLPVDAVRLQVVAEEPLPVGLLPVVEGVPVPVLDHARPARHVGPGLEPELAVPGRELGPGVPADRLRVRLRHEEGGLR